VESKGISDALFNTLTITGSAALEIRLNVTAAIPIPASNGSAAIRVPMAKRVEKPIVRKYAGTTPMSPPSNGIPINTMAFLRRAVESLLTKTQSPTCAPTAFSASMVTWDPWARQWHTRQLISSEAPGIPSAEGRMRTSALPASFWDATIPS